MKKAYAYGCSIICALVLIAGCTGARGTKASDAPLATQSAPASFAPTQESAPAFQNTPEVGNTQESAAPANHLAHQRYNYGDYRSETLAIKAWKALSDKDLNAALAYTNKCITMYAKPAAKMQKSLTDYPTGDKKIFSYWALNDVATCLYIKGEALRRAGRKDEAKVAFERIVNEFFYGQTYDVDKKTFWKPVDGAKDSLYMIDHNVELNFGDMTSNAIVQQMWKALQDKNLDVIIGYDLKLEHLYRQEALNMQKSLKDYPSGTNDQIFKYWALNDLGTGMFILGEAYRMSGKDQDAINAYNKVNNDYLYAQCWDPHGWFWKPAEAALQRMEDIKSGST